MALAKAYESRDDAVEAILGGKVVARWSYPATKGRKGGRGMQEMLYPTSFPEVDVAGQSLRAHHRWAFLRRYFVFPSATSAVEAASGAIIALIEDGALLRLISRTAAFSCGFSSEVRGNRRTPRGAGSSWRQSPTPKIVTSGFICPACLRRQLPGRPQRR